MMFNKRLITMKPLIYLPKQL
uniref:Uncharacterized protein n=1 Tax=Rhizophora mucronata TaxID=61149 RepID=A0A2P2J0U0_RHIMU